MTRFADSPMPDPSPNRAFDRYAASYDEALDRGLSVSGEDKNYFASARLSHLAGCLEQLSFTPDTAMDFGCGTGSATAFAFEAFPHLRRFIGTDVSEPSLEVARRLHSRERAEFHVMSGYQPRGEVDLVFCNGVFHHIPPDQRTDYIRYVHDCLRPGGLFALFENNPWNPGTRYVMSRIPFDRDAIPLPARVAKDLASEGGFDLVRTDFLFVFPRLLRWLRPLERLVCKLPLGAQYLVLGVKPSRSSLAGPRSG